MKTVFRAACAAAAVTIAVSACGTDPATSPPATEPVQEDTAPLEPSPATTGPAATTAVVPTTQAPDEPAPVTTEPEPGDEVEPPQMTVWSTPRLFGTTLTAEWQVTPDEATCAYDLSDADGNHIGTGVATTSPDNTRGRGIRAEYDPASLDSLGTVSFQCTHRGVSSDILEFQVRRVTYQNRSENSVFPADDRHYFDHDEVAALFPECREGGRPPQGRWDYGPPNNITVIVDDVNGDGHIGRDDWLEMGLDFWESVFENWDTEVHEVGGPGGKGVASGWWTTAQLQMYIPNGEVTPQKARAEAFYGDNSNNVNLLWLYQDQENYLNLNWTTSPVRYIGGDGETHYVHPNLYQRLEDAVGWFSEEPDNVANWSIRSRHIRDDGISGSDQNPRNVQIQYLLWEWMDTRYRFVPVDKEPTAWAMRTLLEARSSNCVAARMNAHCRSGDFHTSPHMRHPSQGGSRLGAVLWSAICPDIDPNKET